MAFLLEYRCKRLKLAQFLGQLGAFLTAGPVLGPLSEKYKTDLNRKPLRSRFLT